MSYTTSISNGIDVFCYEAPKEVVLDPNAQDFSPKGNGAVAANERIKEVTEYETELPNLK